MEIIRVDEMAYRILQIIFDYLIKQNIDCSMSGPGFISIDNNFTCITKYIIIKHQTSILNSSTAILNSSTVKMWKNTTMSYNIYIYHSCIYIERNSPIKIISTISISDPEALDKIVNAINYE